MLLLEFVLIEAREEFIVNQMGDKIFNVYKQDRSVNKPKLNSPIEVVKFISQSTTPKAIQWLSKQYVNGKFKLEDLTGIKHSLNVFTNVRRNLDIKDLNQYNTLADLYRAIQPFEQQTIISGKQQKKNQYQNLFDSGQAEMFYNGRTLSVVIPKTKEASCELGKGTKWCTAATISDNMFDDYNEKGPLYIVRTKDGRKFQFHLEFFQFMDEFDDDVKLEDLTKQYPELFDAFENVAIKKLFLPLIKNQTPEICLAAVKQDGYALTFVENQTPRICLAAVKQNGDALEFVENQTPRICLAAVTQNGNVLEFVEKQTRRICLAAVTQNGYALTFVENQTPRICLAAVTQNGNVLEFVEDQTPKICLAAVKQNEDALMFVVDTNLAQQIATKLGITL